MTIIFFFLQENFFPVFILQEPVIFCDFATHFGNGIEIPCALFLEDIGIQPNLDLYIALKSQGIHYFGFNFFFLAEITMASLLFPVIVKATQYFLKIQILDIYLG